MKGLLWTQPFTSETATADGKAEIKETLAQLLVIENWENSASMVKSKLISLLAYNQIKHIINYDSVADQWCAFEYIYVKRDLQEKALFYIIKVPDSTLFIYWKYPMMFRQRVEINKKILTIFM